jgi:putative flippase GtrA
MLSVVVSMLSFTLDFGVLVFLTEVARLYYLISAAISFSLGATMSYALSILFVFEIRRFSSRLFEYGIFMLVGIVGLGLNEALLWALTDKRGIFYLVSKVMAAAIVFFWNFTARKLMLFSGAPDPGIR